MKCSNRDVAAASPRACAAAATPFVFGRGGEGCAALRDAGIEVKVAGGITAGIAAPAAIGVAVSGRRYAASAAFVIGRASDRHPIDWAALAGSG